MRVKQELKINFNFNKVTGEAFKTNLAKGLDNLAKIAKKKVKDTFRFQKDIDGKKYAASTPGYLSFKYQGNYQKIKTNKIMTDTGRLDKSIDSHTSKELLESVVGTPHGRYEKHLENNISGIVRDKAVYKGYRGDYAPVPQRKFFFTSDEEAFEKMEKKIDKEVDAFFDEFVRNLSTSMRKL